MPYHMLRSVLVVVFLIASVAAPAQEAKNYEAFRTLVNTFPSARLQSNHYVITTDSGTGLADTTGSILIRPRFEMSTYNDHVEFRSMDTAILTDRRFDIKQRGPYERYWRLDDAGTLYFVFTRDRKGGIRTAAGRWLIPPQYDPVNNYEGFRWPLVLLAKDGRFGAIDTSTGLPVIPFQFDYLTRQGPYIVGHKGDSSCLYDGLGKLIAARPYHDIRYVDGHFIADIHGMLALLDSRTLLPVTPFVYKEFSGLGTPRYISFRHVEGSTYGVMNTKGKVVLPDRYDYILPLDGKTFAGAQRLGKVLFDQDFRELIPFAERQYFTALTARYEGPPVGDWIVVSVRRETGAPWLWGQEDLNTSYLYHTRLRKAFYYVRRSPDYPTGGVFLDGAFLEVFKPDDKEFRNPMLLQRSGKMLPWAYHSAEPLGNFALKVMQDFKVGLLDAAGRWILKPEWGEIVRVSDSVFAASRLRSSYRDTAAYRLFDLRGRLVSPIEFTEVPHPYGSGYWAKSGERWGILDARFGVAIPLRYFYKPMPLYEPYGGLQDSSRLLVRDEAGEHIIARSGEALFSVRDASISPLANALLVRKGDSSAVVRYDGRPITPYVPGKACFVLNHFGDAAVKISGRWGILGYSGDTLQPFVYDTVMKIPLQPYWALRRGATYTVVNAVGATIAAPIACLPARVSSDGRMIVCDTGRAFVRHSSRWREERGTYVATTQPLFNQNELFHFETGNRPEIRSGIYNRSLRRIGAIPHPDHFHHLRKMHIGSLLLYPDAAARRFAVLDTGGRVVLPYKSADSFWLLPRIAIAADSAARKYVIYHLEKAHAPDTSTAISLEFLSSDRIKDRFGVLPTWSPFSGIFTWYGNGGTGVVNIGTGLDTFLADVHVQPRLQIDGRPLARPINGKYWGLLSAKNLSWALPPEQDTIYTEGHTVRFRRQGRMGLLARGGLQELIPPVWDTIFGDGGTPNRPPTYWIAKRDGKYSIVLRGGSVLSGNWDYLTPWTQSLYIKGMKAGETYQLYPDGRGGLEAAIPAAPAPQWSGTGDQYIYPFFQNGKRGIYSRVERRILIPALFDQIENEHAFYVCTIESGPDVGTSIYNREGQLKFRLRKPAGLDYLHEGAFWRVLNGVDASALDTNGRVLLPAGYEDIWRIGADLFAVRKGGRHGIAATGGRLIEPLRWDGMEALYTPLVAYKDGTACLMEVKGNAIVKRCYDEVIQKGYYRDTRVFEWYASKGGKWGRVTHDGKVLVPFEFRTYEEVRQRDSRYSD